ncbi:hypothetical protein M569_13886 [Genlisea aurea]|uniref:PDZ domain-containing protein n=1 Tax=Genlisea aurea TaxID=192259 RepID=S8C9A1_9LAMI|nr:hypothetical protein M569_13886 [Genlisea aurea]
MVAPNLKAEVMKLAERRAEMEAEMNVIIGNLCRPGGPGLSGNLIDSEGFPRSDIDIPAVRADRRRLAELRYDHRDVTEKMNQNIQLLHTGGMKSADVMMSSSSSSSSDYLPPSLGSSSGMDVDLVVGRPFAVVDEIIESSPAAEDGLQLGDQIVKFGSVEMGENLFMRLVEEAQAKQGQPVPVAVIRRGTLINILVTPRAWSGRGLLG